MPKLAQLDISPNLAAESIGSNSSGSAVDPAEH